MGVDLKLFPITFRESWSAFDSLDVERRRELWDDIVELPSLEIPKPVYCTEGRDDHGEPCHGEVTESPYGARLRWVNAGDLLTLKDHEAVRDNWRNRAVWAYLAEMPADWPIVLYWH